MSGPVRQSVSVCHVSKSVCQSVSPCQSVGQFISQCQSDINISQSEVMSVSLSDNGCQSDSSGCQSDSGSHSVSQCLSFVLSVNDSQSFSVSKSVQVIQSKSSQVNLTVSE